ncbi:MAG: SDR family NAD(P)-dependent oxidoreductase [Bryobacteraceae bacterium]
MMNLQNKVCLVTGGTKGIGAAVAVALAQHGADVAINGRREDAEGRQVLERIGAVGRRGHLVVADVSVPAEATRSVEETRRVLGPVDVLVHSAGGPASGDVLGISAEAWYAAFDIHVHAAFHLCRAAIPDMKRRREGAIILVSSVAALRGVPNAVAYCTVKAALPQFTRSLARDLADDNIRVNCIAPGIIRTRFHENMTAGQARHNIENRIPLHREGSADDVAEVVMTLVTNEFMTGETVTVDGGMTMRIV